MSDVVNQDEAKSTILRWFDNWKSGTKPLLIYGPPGSGKTCAIEALARERHYDFIEMNASDVRSAEQIKDVIGRSMTQQSLFKKGKIFLLDEIDGLYGREDTGGVKEIINIIKETRHRIILISNNPYDPKLRALRQYCELVKFIKIHIWDIVKRLEFISKSEGIKVDRDILKQIASRSEGDLRAAINDLETMAQQKKELTYADLENIDYRERETNIFDALKMIFKTKTALAAKLSINNVDKDPDEIFWWIENNIASEYEKPEEIAKAFDFLSKADLFRQRVSSRQNWTFKSYMIDLMTAGVATSKKEMYRKFTRYQYPQRIAVLGSTKESRAEEKIVFNVMSKNLNCSVKKFRKEFLPFLRIIIKNKEMAKQISSSFGLKLEDTLNIKKY